jgi:WD40 repeat protein
MDDAVSLAFSPDNQLLATGSLDGTLRLWDIMEGTLLMESTEHHRSILPGVYTAGNFYSQWIVGWDNCTVGNSTFTKIAVYTEKHNLTQTTRGKR